MRLVNRLRSRRCVSLIVGIAAAAALTVAVAPAGSAAEVAEFASAGDATVKPGVMTRTEGAQCTANFVFTDGTDVFLGQAAHCAGTGGSTETDGCTAGSLPLGTPVEVEGASRPGTLAYSSWLSMQETGETDPDTCAFNDFALVRLDPADVSRTNPTMPFYGGPSAVEPDGTNNGDTVYAYSNSSLRQGIEALRPKTGTSLGTSGGGRTHTVLTALPGIPGDSGSGYLTANGTAFGILSTLNIAPEAGTNGVSDLRAALDYANDNGDLSGTVELVPGTEPFRAQPVPLDVGAGTGIG
ncbi:serine protease [Pseudonocardia parietis]|uniref:Serine protease n=1 Tax=Pseudonocardia parietis TaxID=570936 RepID=A0ABS4W7A0_9PSEU|nr:serine protease [Pseudonocardia parietis]MBP2371876.1 hypothetical protein [Pseudonocardia parietis]